MTVQDDEDDLAEIMFEGFDRVWDGIAALLDEAGATPRVHERARAWMESTLIPWIDQRRGAVLREAARNMLDLERTIARIDKALAGR